MFICIDMLVYVEKKKLYIRINRSSYLLCLDHVARDRIGFKLLILEVILCFPVG